MKHSRFSRKPIHKATECWKIQHMFQNMTSVQQWEEWDTKDAIWCNIHNGSRVHNTFRNHEGDIIKFMADGRDNVSMQPVPMSNIGSKRQDRTYKVVAHTTETQTRSTSMSNYGYTTEKPTLTVKSPEITTTCMMKKTSNITHH
jgi:hypothetical protein